MKKKIFVLILTFVLLLQAPTALAVSFTDVNRTDNNAWAYDYIIELAEKKIISGYPDGSYKPANEVTYLETLKLLFGIMNPDRTEVNAATEKYKNFMTETNTPEWARDAVATALYRGVVTESEYKNAAVAGLVGNNPSRKADRRDVSVYMARALELKPKSNPNLSYKDAGYIELEDAGYLSALIDTGVLNKDGRDGYFAGDKSIKRSEMAKMVKYAYDYKSKNPVVRNTETVTGTVYSISLFTDKYFAVITPSNSTSKESYKIDANTKIYDNANKSVSMSNLEKFEGSQVTIKYYKDNNTKVATELKFGANYAAVDGEYTFNSFRTENKKYIVNVTDKDRNKKEFVSNLSYAKNGDAEIFIQDINPDTKVNLKFKNGMISEFRLSEPQIGEYRVIRTGETISGEKTIEVTKIRNNQDYTYNLNKYCTYVKGTSPIQYGSINRDDIVDLNFGNSDQVNRVVVYPENVKSGNEKYYIFDGISNGRITVYSDDSSRTTRTFDLASYVDYGDFKYAFNIREKKDEVVLEFNSRGEVTKIDRRYASSNKNGISVKYTYENGKFEYYDVDERDSRWKSASIRNADVYVDGSKKSTSWLEKSGSAYITFDKYGDISEIRIGENDKDKISVKYTYENGKFEYYDVDSNGRWKSASIRNADIYVDNTRRSTSWLEKSGYADIKLDRYGDVTEIRIGENKNGEIYARYTYSGGTFEYRNERDSSSRMKEASLRNADIYVDGRKRDTGWLDRSGYAYITFDKYGDIEKVELEDSSSNRRYETYEYGNVRDINERGDYIEYDVKLERSGSEKVRLKYRDRKNLSYGDRVRVIYDRNGEAIDIEKY